MNVEPRFSPDGKRIVFVSTSFKRHFHIFVGDFAAGQLSHIERLTGEHMSELPRYYYSAADHEISPVWSRDGKEILYISNRNHIYGTGGFWRMPARAGAAGREIHYEETNWRARPDMSPDGSRVVFGSYSGRQWHNLWLMPAQGGDPFRSPSATGIRSTRAGPRTDGASPSSPTVTATRRSRSCRCPAASVQPLAILERHYLNPTGELHIALRTHAGAPRRRGSVSRMRRVFPCARRCLGPR